MNQKDYKAIAEIIKNNQIHRETSVNCITSDLADYFEKEYKDSPTDGEDSYGKTILRVAFNRTQFLKDCGIEEED